MKEEIIKDLGINFYGISKQIIGEVPLGSYWLYDVGTLLIIILLFALFLGIPIYLIVSITSRR